MQIEAAEAAFLNICCATHHSNPSYSPPTVSWLTHTALPATATASFQTLRFPSATSQAAVRASSVFLTTYPVEKVLLQKLTVHHKTSCNRRWVVTSQAERPSAHGGVREIFLSLSVLAKELRTGTKLCWWKRTEENTKNFAEVRVKTSRIHGGWLSVNIVKFITDSLTATGRLPHKTHMCYFYPGMLVGNSQLLDWLVGSQLGSRLKHLSQGFPRNILSINTEDLCALCCVTPSGWTTLTALISWLSSDIPNTMMAGSQHVALLVRCLPRSGSCSSCLSCYIDCPRVLFAPGCSQTLFYWSLHPCLPEASVGLWKSADAWT